MSTSDLTTTSYSILGLLAVRPFTTYELAQQMDRSLKRFWPRAQSRIYEEPKRLAALGLAKATAEKVGRRPRTLYSITARGRRALAAWLGQPGGGPVLEFENLLKLFFAEQGTKHDAVGHVAAIQRYAEEQNAVNIAFARMYLETGGPFPERLASIVLIGRFLTDFADMLGSWSAWAAGVVEAWPNDGAPAEPDWQTLRTIAGRAMPPARREISG